MTYTFIGDKNYIQREINKLCEDFSSENISHYNLEEHSFDKVMEDLDTVSLFGNKLIIVENIDKLDDMNTIEKYLNNESSNTLVLISYKELDKRKKITKLLNDKTKVKEFLNNDIEKVINEKIEDYSMDTMCLNTLISYCSNNINKIENELEKLKMFKYEDKKITKDDVEKLVKKSYDATIFDLIDSINTRNIDKVFEIYNGLIEENSTEEQILYTIANHYRLLYQISVKLKALSDDEIIKEYHMHPYRLVKLKEQLNLISDKEIERMLKSLSDIDISYKSGAGDISTLMYMFFNNL